MACKKCGFNYMCFCDEQDMVVPSPTHDETVAPRLMFGDDNFNIGSADDTLQLTISGVETTVTRETTIARETTQSTFSKVDIEEEVKRLQARINELEARLDDESEEESVDRFSKLELD